MIGNIYRDKDDLNRCLLYSKCRLELTYPIRFHLRDRGYIPGVSKLGFSAYDKYCEINFIVISKPYLTRHLVDFDEDTV